MEVVSSFTLPSLSLTSSSYPRRTTTMGHHDDACTLFIPCFKSLFSPSGARANIVGSNSCANGIYSVNITLTIALKAYHLCISCNK
jgi:hypothetical protein